MIEFLAGFVIGGILGGFLMGLLNLAAEQEIELNRNVRNSDNDEHGEGL